MDNNSVNSNGSIHYNIDHVNSGDGVHHANSGSGAGGNHGSSSGGIIVRGHANNGYASSPMYSWPPQSPFVPAQPSIQGFGHYSNPALGLENAFSGLTISGGRVNQHAYQSPVASVGDLTSVNNDYNPIMNHAYSRVEGVAAPFYGAPYCHGYLPDQATQDVWLNNRLLINHHPMLCSDRFQNGVQPMRSSLVPYHSVDDYFTPYPSRSGFYRDRDDGSTNELRGIGVHQHVPLNDQFGMTGLVGLRRKLCSSGMDKQDTHKLGDAFDYISRDEVDMLFGEVIGNISNLMMNQSGRYLFEKIVPVCSVNQRNEIISAITRDTYNFGRICLNAHGTRSVQTLLQYLNTEPQMRRIVAAIKHDVLRLCKDSNGHHVVVHCILHFPLELSQVIFDVVTQHCFDIAIDKCGCCVLQKCMDFSRGETRRLLWHEIISVALLLCEDRYGNYVVQHLITQEAPQSDRLTNHASLLKKLKGNFVSLSCSKFGSNVIEKLLENADKRHVELIIMEFLESPNVSILFSDQFGNYVAQAALGSSKGYAHDVLVREIQKHAPSLQSNQFGKKILSWFDTKKRNKGYSNGKSYMSSFHH